MDVLGVVGEFIASGAGRKGRGEEGPVDKTAVWTHVAWIRHGVTGWSVSSLLVTDRWG
jgi:hypothetical protein